MALLSLIDVARSHGAGRPLLAGVSLVVRDADRIGLIGANGSGKSTLLRILAGSEAPDAGERVVRRGIRIGMLAQEPVFAPEHTVREVVRAGLAERNELAAELDQVHAALAQPDLAPHELERLLRRQERLSARLEASGGHDVEHEIEAWIDGVGLPDPDARCATLSGGEARRAALAQLLVRSPDLLLLDEPTNHLDAFVIAWLEERLAELAVPFVLVTHDRYLLDRVVDRIVEIDRGSAHAYEGGYASYVEARAARLAAEQQQESVRLGALRRETAWMRRGPPARTTKAKARIARYQALAADVPPPSLAELELAFPAGRRLGTKGIELRGVAHRYGERLVLPELDLELTSGMRLGIVGRNGAGKSTLVAILLGRLKPTQGQVIVGETVVTATIDQRRADLDPELSVVEEVAGRADHVVVGGRRIHVASFLDRFLFPGPRKDVRIGSLSGGERGRVLLAKLLLTGANVLVLDEPTNDLDLPTLRALEEALQAFEGTVVVVSHDRWFLDRVATHVLHLDGRGGSELFTGDATTFLERLAREKEPVPSAARAAARGRAALADQPAAAGKPLAKKALAPWERRELEELLERIAALEGELSGLDRRLSDPALYAGDGSAGRALHDERTRAAEALAAALARWEELAERDG